MKQLGNLRRYGCGFALGLMTVGSAIYAFTYFMIEDFVVFVI